jgi:hypothetical protein
VGDRFQRSRIVGGEGGLSFDKWAERTLDPFPWGWPQPSPWAFGLMLLVLRDAYTGHGPYDFLAVDLQTQDANGVVQLYAIQASPNTKNAGGRKSDIDALRRGARALRGHRQRVELNIAVLVGRLKTGPIRDHSDITVVGSDDFWERVSGIPDFRARLLRATTILGWLVKRRSQDEVARIKAEGLLLFADAEGQLDLEALAHAPRSAREERQALLARAVEEPD